VIYFFILFFLAIKTRNSLDRVNVVLRYDRYLCTAVGFPPCAAGPYTIFKRQKTAIYIRKKKIEITEHTK